MSSSEPAAPPVAPDLRPDIRAIFRIETPRLVAGLTRVVRDVGLAEELAQDALVAALEQWPQSGIPPRPGAWLMTTARHKAIDLVRRERMRAAKHDALGRETRGDDAAPDDLTEDDAPSEVGDDLLRLMLVACHPILPTEGRVALTLRLLGGLTTEEIARAFLVPTTTLQQRIVRAKKTLAEAKVPFEVPRGADLAARIGSVLEVLYLVFNEGYSATSGDDWVRPQLCNDALRLARVLAGIAPHEPEVHGLVALMEIQASRLRARVGPDGEPVLLLDQDRGRWDWVLVHRGLAALAKAESLGAPAPGSYQLQAAIAACHARARSADATDWRMIAALYLELVRLTRSPVVELNRAVAVGMAYGPDQALVIVDQLVAGGALAGYHLLPTVRGDLLVKLGRHGEAAAELEHAATLARNPREQRLLQARARAAREAAG